MELVTFPSRGGFSARGVFGIALTVLITAFLWVIVFPTHDIFAATTATWNGTDVILFDGHGFNKADDVKDTTGTIPAGSTIYKAPVQPATAGESSQRLLVIYFAPGVDPPTATSAQYVEFDYTAGSLSNPQKQQSVSMTPQSQSDGTGSSCSVGGIGWVICPVSIFLAESMDNIFNFLANLMKTQPLVLGDSNNSMYVAWNIMRSIANIAFVIVFLIIIYSQLTSIGISNYGLKKLIPRLVVAAVLVNVSYYIGAVAIDLSNIIGVSLQNMFVSIRENVFHMTNDTFAGVNNNPWTTVTTVVLAGGGVIGGAFFASQGGLYLLIPILLGVGITALLVLIVLAARQAIIVILMIIAPLAFVANLLPNTEKWYKKWQELFMTMLIFFPAFSLVFGGSQLAGQVIIQNAGDNIITVIFGMAVQIAPLVITPLLLKLSGNVLGAIGNLANKQRGSVMNPTRDWAKRRAEHAKQKNIALGPRWRNPSSVGAGMVRRMDNRRRRLQDKTDLWTQEATNNYEETPQYGDIHERKAASDYRKEAIHSHHAAHIDTLRAGNGVDRHNVYGQGLAAETAKEHAETAKNTVASHYNDMRVRGGQALYASSYALEVSKTRLEDTEAAKNAYYTNQKATNGTQLYNAMESLETTKVRLESAQSRYATTVDTLKIDSHSTLNGAIQTAQTTKQQAEAAQVRLQTYLDTQNRTTGSVTNASYVELERAKVVAEGAKSQLATYTTDLKTINGINGQSLHTEFIETEHVKHAQQTAEAKLARTIEEYKAGGATDPDTGITVIDGVALNQNQVKLATSFKEENARLIAEKQGAVSAQYVQQSYIAGLMDETSSDPLSAQVLQTAAGIDPNGKNRAQANAVAQLEKLTQEALSNGVTMLGNRAQRRGITIKTLAQEIYAKQVGKYRDGNGVLQPRQEQDPSVIEAALEALARDGDIPTLRDARLDVNAPFIDQSMLTRIFARNDTTTKQKGGYDLAVNPGLAGVNREEMDLSVADSLGEITAAHIADQKYGWWKEVSVSIPRIISNIETYPNISEDERIQHTAALRKLYRNTTTALRSKEVVDEIGDRIEETIAIHEYLHNYFHDSDREIDYRAVRGGSESPWPLP